MRVIVAGSRQGVTYELVRMCIEVAREQGLEITQVVSGKATGADAFGEDWAKANGVPVLPFPAKWKDARGNYDPKAGFRRNWAMAEYADALIAVWNGYSSGTRHMIEVAQKKGLRVFVLNLIEMQQNA